MKKNSASSILSMLRISVVSGIFVGIVLWGAVRDWTRVYVFAGCSVVIVFIGLMILNWLAKPDPDVKPGQTRLK